MTNDYNTSTCEEKLKEAKLEPVCPKTHCEEMRQTRIYHEFCVDRPIYAPVQSIGCYNSKTGEWRFDRPNQISHICEELKIADPDWELTECYCCCWASDATIEGVDNGEDALDTSRSGGLTGAAERADTPDGPASTQQATPMRAGATLEFGREPPSLERSRERFAEILGLDAPVSEPVLAAALEHKTYAHNLLATRGTPEMMAPLLADPPAVAREASTVVLAGRAAKALATWARTGFTVVDDATYQQRIRACASCPHELQATRHPKLHRWIADGERPKVCGLCGCAVAKKARLSAEQCPAEDVERPGVTRWGEPRR